jgi:hypothetical protein
MPDELVTRARRTAQLHGVSVVARAVKVDRRLLEGAPRACRVVPTALAPQAPAYSRVELVAPSSLARAVAELEMPNGVKLRLHLQTQEVLSLLSSVCTSGGGR